MPLLTIFLDTSVILSGLASPIGGSRKLFEAAKRHKIKLLTTSLVLQEAVNHLQKLDIEPHQLETLFSTKTIHLVANPPEKMIEKFRAASPDPDDAHVLAGAGLSGANVLVSLDKKHLLTAGVRRVLKPMLVKSPRDFWKWSRKQKR